MKKLQMKVTWSLCTSIQAFFFLFVPETLRSVSVVCTGTRIWDNISDFQFEIIVSYVVLE